LAEGAYDVFPVECSRRDSVAKLGIKSVLPNLFIKKNELVEMILHIYPLIFLKNGMKNKLNFALKILGQIGICWGEGVCLKSPPPPTGI
jgi:hypothetical protein